jgi:hypothetical protein
MKVLYFLLFLVVGTQANGQTNSNEVSHHGFYLSVGAGPAFGSINVKNYFGSDVKIKGTAFGMDIQIGGAILENLFLHGTLAVKSIFGYKINETPAGSSDSYSENFLGAGITKYTKNNFFFTLNAGVADFTAANNGVFIAYGDYASTDLGFSFNIKAGKEWAVGRRWGFGGVIFYSRTFLKSNNIITETEKWNSNKAGIYF